jgi:hypothetical protein
VNPGRVPVSTKTLCHDNAISPTLKAVFIADSRFRASD